MCVYEVHVVGGGGGGGGTKIAIVVQVKNVTIVARALLVIWSNTTAQRQFMDAYTRMSPYVLQEFLGDIL